MYRKLLSALALVLVLPLMLFAQDGKLRGTVKDSQSGEPLIGANVIIDGTSLGSSSDINGEFVILGVPPGSYTVKASYIGYAPVTITDVRVSANLTTTQDFQLSSTAIQTGEVEVVADRPLIQRNTTNTVRVMTQDDIKDLPIRGVSNFVALQAGVVERDNRLYIRGGRAGEVSYYVDGANTTNPVYKGTNSVLESFSVTQESVEEIQLQSGGMTAEFGGAASGVIRTSTRTGGPELSWTLDYRTDDFAKPGEEFLGTSSFGYRNAVGTIGGPVMNGIRFFLTGQHSYTRQSQRMYLEPFRFDSLRTDQFGITGASGAGVLLPNDGTIEIKRNYLYNNWTMQNSGIGTLLFDLNQLMQVPLKVKFTGSVTYYKSPNGTSWPGALTNYFRDPSRLTMFENLYAFSNVRLTHVLGPTTFYEVGLTYQDRNTRNFDQDFEDSWRSYSDSAAWVKKGMPTDEWRTRYQGPIGYSTIYQFPSQSGFTHPMAPNSSYSKNRTQQVGVTLDFTSQVNQKWELKAGGNIESWTWRSYSTSSAGYWLLVDPNQNGVLESDEPLADAGSDYERRVILQKAVITNIGYDLNGKQIDGENYTLPNGSSVELDKPRTPLFAAAYIQNKFEYDDLILNIGARYEYYDASIPSLPKTVNPITGEEDYANPPIDDDLNFIEEDKLVESEAFSYLLPRLNFAFPVTDRTVFYAQYGKFAQLPRLDQLYSDNTVLNNRTNPSTRNAYNLGAAAVPFTARPERNTQYETGIRQTLSDNLALTISGFYKDMRDQLQLRRIFSSQNIPLFVGFVNEDFGTVKGLEMTLELRRTQRVAARINYTLSDARGTGSTSRSSQNGVTDEASARFPNFVNPLDYNQTHRGTVNLDYSFPKGDGGQVLEGFGANMLLTFNSGHNYTKIQEIRNLGQSSPWTIGVRALQDSRGRNPVEPINASTTPWVFNVDLNVRKVFFTDYGDIVVYAQILNLFDTKQILNVYPNSGSPYDDGWLKTPFATAFKDIPNYEAFYRAVNLQNRWAYMNIGATGGLGQQGGGDIFGAPRQVVFGVRFEM